MSFAEVSSETALREAGRCIYCGAEDDLSDEHIIPFALGGNLYVPKASCPRCRDLTSRFESRVLRGFMYRARVAGNFPTRRPRERPNEVGVTLLDGENPRNFPLPRQSAPGVLQLPIFEPPRFLQGQSNPHGIGVRGLEAIHFGPNLEEVVRSHGAAGLRQSDAIEWEDFTRMLAKIGYSFTVGVFGLVPLEQALVLPFIRGETHDAGTWVGSAQYELESEKRGALHGLAYEIYQDESEPPHRLLVARVKLFASSGATGFEVVVRYV
jgi:hypothetical protein